MSFWKKCPLLAAVIVSGLVIEGAGVANGVKSGEIENPASWKQPALATVFIDLKQGVYPWSDRSVQTAAMDAADVQKDRITEETALQEEDGEGSGQSGISAEAQKTDWIYRKPAGRRMLTGMQIIKTEPETKMRQT